MSEVAIRVDNLGKQGRIGAAQPRYKTLRESLVDTRRVPFRLLSNSEFAIRNPQFEMYLSHQPRAIRYEPSAISHEQSPLSRPDPDDGPYGACKG